MVQAGASTESDAVNAPVGDAAHRRREAARRAKEWALQGALVLALILLVWMIAGNVADNLAARNIRSGFGFLQGSAGFDIGESLIAFSSSDTVLRAFAAGVLNTLRVAAFAIITATLLGVVVGLMRLARHPIIRGLGTAHVEVYRNIPLIIQLLALYLLITELLPMSTDALHLGDWALLSKAGLQIAVPESAGLALLAAGIVFLLTTLLVRERYRRRVTDLVATLSGFWIGILAALVVWMLFGAVGGWSKPHIEGFAIEGGASLSPEFLALWLGLTLFTSASIAEIVRAGVLAVSVNQWHAGLALGMSKVQTVSYVVFPQSMRLAIPPLASQYMNLTKNSSLAVVIGYPDFVAVGNASINVTGQAIEIICVVMAVYLVLNLIIALAMNALNARILRAPR
ncbi:MAG: ABC transporter permease subunit [Duodenibacillus sp.]|nr:ABC transporter permease subunit [Duodenibacillus sp.]